ncbi:hypothetical protein ACFV6E_17035 [Streptomyces sp. NPDC059785]|uniref:hypothetical protein n=1 Tax=unclassified Streptomyces TaxID=2593676 RepID=UPI00364C0897
MLTEVVVAAIGAAGTLGVAYLARGPQRRERRDSSAPLLDLSEHCGYIRGLAEAAVLDCERVLALLSDRRSSRIDWPLRETYEVFVEKAAPLDGSQVEAVQLRRYADTVSGFASELAAVCEKMHRFAEQPAPGRSASRTRALRRLAETDLPGLRRRLPSLDERFDTLLESWLETVRLRVPPGATRYFARRSRRHYQRHVSMGRSTAFLHPRTREVPATATRDPEPVATPACNNCVWQCPHAPFGSGGPGDRPLAPPA